MEELQAALEKLHATYPVIRLKNKTDTPLSQVLVNYEYIFDHPGLTFSNEMGAGFAATHYHVGGGTKTWVAEMQFVLKSDESDSHAKDMYNFHHKIYEIDRADDTLFAAWGISVEAPGSH